MRIPSSNKSTVTITALVTETSSPCPPVSPWPLLYKLEVEDPTDQDKIRLLVALERFREIEQESALEHMKMVGEIADGLVLHFVLDGDVRPLFDFRE